MHCSISRPSIFERKGYYYPDLPKNFQISQKRSPLGLNGYLEIGVNGGATRVRISDVHIEEDAAKLLHPEDDPQHSLVDFNRGGMPLLEIVSHPDMHSVAEVEAYMSAVRSMLRYLGISDARMEQGQLRFEASISLAGEGATELGTRVEIKNLNSFRAVLGAVEHEIRRQTQALDKGEVLYQETRLWDDARGVTEPMRRKETAMDYRYFPEPDLVPLEIDDEWIARVQAELPELEDSRRKRIAQQYDLTDYDARILVSERALADLLEETVAAGAPAKAAANWITGRLLYHINERGLDVENLALKPATLAELVQMVASGAVSGPAARQVLDRIVESGESPTAVVQELGLSQISDAGEISSVISEVIAENLEAVESFRKGKEAALKFLVGQVMRKSKGRANPQLATELLKERIAPG
jgi:aspartyl-tRNA(Asn)/glutamyl-tRNA(Gln) amidotransferase subunit B